MSTQPKKIHTVLTPKEEHWVGDGFYVSTILSLMALENKYISPFVLMDHAARRYFPPTEDKKGVGEHPHRGFETVTFAIEGEIDHRDSGGGGGTITTGGVQWMTAGSGVVHDEFHSRKFAADGGDFEMVQLWVNLPKAFKMTTPRYQSLNKEDFPTFEMAEGKVQGEVIAGDIESVKGPALTHSPINIFKLKAKEDCQFSFNLGEGSNTLIFNLSGEGKLQGQKVGPRDLTVFEREGQSIQAEMKKDCHWLVLNGEPIDEPIFHYGPFVMNTRDEIKMAIADFQAGKMGTLVEEVKD